MSNDFVLEMAAHRGQIARTTNHVRVNTTTWSREAISSSRQCDFMLAGLDFNAYAPFDQLERRRHQGSWTMTATSGDHKIKFRNLEIESSNYAIQ